MLINTLVEGKIPNTISKHLFNKLESDHGLDGVLDEEKAWIYSFPITIVGKVVCSLPQSRFLTFRGHVIADIINIVNSLLNLVLACMFFLSIVIEIS